MHEQLKYNDIKEKIVGSFFKYISFRKMVFRKYLSKGLACEFYNAGMSFARKF